ncbi:MAG: hypothetical protein LBR27_06470 [Bifidobacteriaceae bacterium]|jgi:hypothetical protein|nr:hypothetical protein [Bifidobacteriaceae bacterium]
MSAVPAVAVRRSPSATPAGGVAVATPPALRLVAPPKRRRGYVLYLSSLIALLVGGLTCVLYLRTELAAGAFEIHELEQQLSRAEATYYELEEQLTLRSAPDWLAARAVELGMVPSEGTAYLLLGEGKIVGSAPAAIGTVADDAAAEGADGATGEVVGDGYVADDALAGDAVAAGGVIEDEVAADVAAATGETVVDDASGGVVADDAASADDALAGDAVADDATAGEVGAGETGTGEVTTDGATGEVIE